MFQNLPDWEKLQDPSAALDDCFEHANTQQEKSALGDLRKHPDWELVGGREMQPAFYPGSRIFEFSFEEKRDPQDRLYSYCALYVVRTPTDARVLNGKSPVIHDLNRGQGGTRWLDLTSESRAIQYLDFFTTFVAGDEGPFFVIESVGESLWPKADGDEVLLEPFAEIVRKQRTATGQDDEFLSLNGEELEKYREDPEAAKASFAQRYQAKRSAQLDSDGAKLAQRVAGTGTEWKRTESEDGAPIYRCTRAVWYGGHVFEADFEWEATGMVKMNSDRPIGVLNHPEWKVLHGPPLFVRKVPRKAITPREALDAIEAQEDGLWRLANVRVEGELNIQGRELDCGIDFDDVQVTGSFVVDGVRTSERIVLRSVEVLERFSAQRLSADSVEAPGLRVRGAFGIPDDDRMEPADGASLTFRKATLTRGLAMPRATVRGTVDLSYIDLGGNLDLRGLDVAPRARFVRGRRHYHQCMGLDLSEARVGGRIHLGTVANSTIGSVPTRTDIVGTVTMSHAVVGGGMDLSSAKILTVPSGIPIGPEHVSDEVLRAVRSDDPFQALRVGYDAVHQRVVALNPGIGGVEPALTVSRASIGGDIVMGAFSYLGELSGFEVHGSVSMDRMICEGDVSLSAATIGTVALRLDGVTSSVESFGGFSLRRSEIGAFYASSWSEKLGADGLTIHQLRLQGELDLSKAKVLRSVTLDGVHFGAGFAGAELWVGRNLEVVSRLVASQLTGNLWLDRASIGGRMFFSGLKLTGSLRAASAKVQSVRMEDARPTSTGHQLVPVSIEGGVLLGQATVEKDVVLVAIQVGGAVIARDVRVGGNWHILSTTGDSGRARFGFRTEPDRAATSTTIRFDSAKVMGRLVLEGVQVAGAVNLSSLHSREVVFQVGGDGDACELGGSLRADWCNVAKNFVVSGIRLDGGLSVSGARVGGMLDGDSRPGFRTIIQGAVVLSGAKIGSDVRFNGAVLNGGMQAFTGEFGRFQLRLAWHRELPHSTESAANCWSPEVKSVQVHSAAAKLMTFWGVRVEQDLELVDVEVSHGVSFSNEDWRGTLLALDPASEDCLPERFDHWTAVKGALHLRGLHLGGDLDLTALHCNELKIKQCEVGYNLKALEVDGRRTKAGKVWIGQSLVRGDLELEGLSVTGDVCIHRTEIKGRLATAAGEQELEANSLRVTHSKVPYAAINVGERPVEITDSTIGDLDFKLVGEERLSIDKSQVDSWQPIESAGYRGQYPVEKLMGLVSPFSREAFLAAERSLRRSGSDKHADKVYRQMRWRTLGEARFGGFIRRWPTQALTVLLCTLLAPFAVLFPWSRGVLIGFWTGFFTRGYIPLLPCLVLLPVTWSAARVPSNIAPNTFRMAEQLASEGASTRGGPGQASSGPLLRTDSPTVEEWTVENLVRTMIACHVPVIPFVESPRWEFADERELKLSVPLSWGVGELEVRDSKQPSEGLAPELEPKKGQRIVTVSWLSPAQYGMLVRLLSWIAWPLFLIGLAADLQRHRDQTD